MKKLSDAKTDSAHHFLLSLHKNLPEKVAISENDARSYNKAIMDIQDETKKDLTRFLISEEEITPRKAGDLLEGEIHNTRKRFVKYQIFRTKLEAVLTFLASSEEKPSRKIGFQKPSE